MIAVTGCVTSPQIGVDRKHCGSCMSRSSSRTCSSAEPADRHPASARTATVAGTVSTGEVAAVGRVVLAREERRTITSQKHDKIRDFARFTEPAEGVKSGHRGKFGFWDVAIHEPRLNEAGANRVDAYTLRRMIERGCARETNDAVLRGNVTGEARPGDPPKDGSHIDDRSTLARDAHRADLGAKTVEHGAEVGSHHPVPPFERVVGSCRHPRIAVNPSVVHRDVSQAGFDGDHSLRRTRSISP
jgi:hypothetical protein